MANQITALSLVLWQYVDWLEFNMLPLCFPFTVIGLRTMYWIKIVDCTFKSACYIGPSRTDKNLNILISIKCVSNVFYLMGASLTTGNTVSGSFTAALTRTLMTKTQLVQIGTEEG